MRRPHLPTLVSGIAVLALGIVLLLEGLGSIDLDFATTSPAVLATVGVVLVAAGLAKRDLRG